MKKIMMSFIMLLATVTLFAQTDPIIGKWENPSGEGRVEIYKKETNFSVNSTGLNFQTMSPDSPRKM
ncbi:hypothetical protein [Sphingobacterium sp. E70]|uniref:hypothetical protein n=1 Tax=Sphingobacterium sp. E70 TaxID=2853439 RepID=UPI002795D10F|nr:hypothetical protein [Sphingobacterium sp. E70]